MLIWYYSASGKRDPTRHQSHHRLRQCISYYRRPEREKITYQLKSMYLSPASSIGTFCAVNTRPREEFKVSGMLD